MNDLMVLNALNQSQEGKPLVRFIARHDMEIEDLGDAVNHLLVTAYRQADNLEELASHLRYAVREVTRALDAVQDEQRRRANEWLATSLEVSE